MLIVLGTDRFRAEDIRGFGTPLPATEEGADNFTLWVRTTNDMITLTYGEREVRDIAADLLESLLGVFDVDSWSASILEYRELKAAKTEAQTTSSKE